ncbi:hypothetical protein MNBD_GAMMA23-350 [hydrothermal vent metagenome]|uniref:Methyltransferase type 11 domain-containing protein n=1 Tax=hydrothermal vent metagenome TaxID=652676 RepID=A0A3B0ZMA0_9ZZZZ
MEKTVASISGIAAPELLPANQKLEFVCPLCKEDLTTTSTHYHCRPCKREYPVVAGIPDFRVFPDPYLDFDEDRSRTQIVLDALEQYPLRELLTYYWSYSDVTPPLLRAKFVDNAMRGESRGQRLFDLITNDGEKRPSRFIEIGCGTGNLLATAAMHIEHPVGTDIAMRWLHLSRRRFMDKGLEVPALVCCCAEYLPFKPHSFDAAIMASTFEFLRNPEEALIELKRTLTQDGSCLINTVNRFSLTNNPYAHLWGVGFLPKAWQIKYVRKRRDASFENITLHSYNRMKKTAALSFNNVDIALADISDKTLATLPARTKLLVKIYRLLKKLPIIQQLLKQIAPEWDVRLSSPKQS